MKDLLSRLKRLEAHKQSGGVWLVSSCGDQWEALKSGGTSKTFSTVAAALAFTERIAEVVIVDDL